MIFADKRYDRADKREKLPQWIKSSIKDGQDNLSVDQATSIATRYFKDMGQDFTMPRELMYGTEKIAQVQKEEKPFEGAWDHNKNIV